VAAAGPQYSPFTTVRTRPVLVLPAV